MLNNQRRIEANGWVLVAKFTCKNSTKSRESRNLICKQFRDWKFQFAWPCTNRIKYVKCSRENMWIALTTKAQVKVNYSIYFQVNWNSSRARKTIESWRWWRTVQTSAALKVKDAKITVPVDLQKSVIHQWCASSLCGNLSGQGQMGPGTGS